MSDPRDPATPPPVLPEDERPVPSEPAGPPASDIPPHADEVDMGPDPWDPDAPPPRTPAPPPPPAPPPAEPEAPRAYGAGAPAVAFEGGEAENDPKRPAFAVYLLFLGTFILLIPAFVGWLIAHRNREAAPGWLRSHYVFQIRTFWISFGAAIATVLGFPIGFGPVLFMALVVWVTLRCFVGMVRLHRGEPIYNPQTWMV